MVALWSMTGKSWHYTSEWLGRVEKNVAITSPQLMTLASIHWQSRSLCTSHNSAENCIKCMWVKESLLGSTALHSMSFLLCKALCHSYPELTGHQCQDLKFPPQRWEQGWGTQRTKSSCFKMTFPLLWHLLTIFNTEHSDFQRQIIKENMQDFIFTHILCLWGNALLSTYHDPWSIYITEVYMYHWSDF